MKFKYFIWLLTALLLYQPLVFSQNNQTDSLLNVLAKSKEDTNKVNVLNKLGYNYIINDNNPVKGREYALAALMLSQKIGYKKGEAFAFENLGYSDEWEEKFREGLRNFQSALYINLQIGEKRHASLNYYSIGQKHGLLGNYAQALENYFSSLKLSEEIGFEWIIAYSNNNIGLIYFDQGNYEEALKYYAEALKKVQNCGDKRGIALFTANIADAYKKQGKYSLSLEKQRACIKLFEEAGERNGLGETYVNIGSIYEIWDDYPAALANYSKALKIYEADKSRYGIAGVYIYIGSVYTKLKQYSRAKQYLQDGLSLSKAMGNKQQTRDFYLNMTRLDSAMGNFKNAFLHQSLYFLYRDSLVNEKSRKEQVQTQMKYEFGKKEDQIKILSTENELKTILASQQKQKKNFAYAGIAVILLAGGYGFYRYRRRKKIQRQQAVLSERLRISSELHDEVGATLSGIAMYSHLTKEQMKKGQTAEIEKSLNVMQQSSAEMVDKLNDIVWLINPEQDSLEKLVTRLEEYATDMAAIKNIHVRINVPEKMADINLPVNSRRNIYLFCKEAINNAVKYSNATLLELTVKELNGKLDFAVSDNGKGFDAVLVRRGNGLENMQKRADEIGAKLIVQSKENGGVAVSMQCVTLA